MHCRNSVLCHINICHVNMLVLHTNGIHKVAIQYCDCQQAIPQHIQLLQCRLYLCSQIIVKTCVTFELLHHLHELTLTTKASTYDFYQALEKSRSLHSPSFSRWTLLRLWWTWPIQNANFLALELLEFSSDFPVIFQCRLAGLVSPLDFLMDCLLEYHQNSSESPPEMTGQQRKVQRTPSSYYYY